jgi:hypothetical protein
MLHQVCYFIFIIFNLLNLTTSQFKGHSTAKIPLSKEMIINETTFGNAYNLIDEQESSGDPRAGKGGSPKNSWQAGYNPLYLPAHATIDLGADYFISEIYFYDGEGTGLVEFHIGVPFNWQKIFSDKMDQYQKWKKHQINQQTRYIRITQTSNIGPVEIILYGEKINGHKEKQANSALPTNHYPVMDEFIGINAFIDDPIEKLKAVGFIREYHNWQWVEGNNENYKGYPQNANKWAPSYIPEWNFDQFYHTAFANGLTIAPALQRNVPWLSQHPEFKPVLKGKDPKDPFAYAAHADHMFQFAARYGTKNIPDHLLKLAENQPKHSGLNLIRYYENWNEPDKWWEGRDAYFTPYEFAAMCSADYDGHLQQLGKTYGIKNADPHAKLVMGGLASLNLEYLKSIKLWSDFHRKGSLPFDVINLHHYSCDKDQYHNQTQSFSPEEDKLKEKVKKIVDYRNKEMAGKEIWITEFGYDTHPGSPQGVPMIKGFSAEEVQAQWLIRSFLILSSTGIDKAALYMLRDVNDSPSKYTTSGITYSKHKKWAPKTSWFYVYSLKNILKGMRFYQEESHKQAKIYIYQNADGSKKTYAIWLPTSKGETITDFTLQVPDSLKRKKITLFELTDNSINGKSTPLDDKHLHRLTLSETPIFIGFE